MQTPLVILQTWEEDGLRKAPSLTPPPGTTCGLYGGGLASDAGWGEDDRPLPDGLGDRPLAAAAGAAGWGEADRCL